MTITSINYLHSVQNALGTINSDQLDHIVDLIIKAKMIVTCGNGGSAATAIHFASDLRMLGYAALDLLSPSKITQIANDQGGQHIWRSQLLALDAVLDNALIIAFSASGTSKNIQTLAYGVGERVVLFSSEMHAFKYPGVYVLRVDSTDYEVIEDVHLALCHAIKKELEMRRE